MSAGSMNCVELVYISVCTHIQGDYAIYPLLYFPYFISCGDHSVSALDFFTSAIEEGGLDGWGICNSRGTTCRHRVPFLPKEFKWFAFFLLLLCFWFNPIVEFGGFLPKNNNRNKHEKQWGRSVSEE